MKVACRQPASNYISQAYTFSPPDRQHFVWRSGGPKVSVLSGTVDAQFLNLAGDRVAADAEPDRGIVLAAMGVLERGANQRRFELTAEGIHDFGLAIGQHAGGHCFQQ